MLGDKWLGGSPWISVCIASTLFLIGWYVKLWCLGEDGLWSLTPLPQWTLSAYFWTVHILPIFPNLAQIPSAPSDFTVYIPEFLHIGLLSRNFTLKYLFTFYEVLKM